MGNLFDIEIKTKYYYYINNPDEYPAVKVYMKKSSFAKGYGTFAGENIKKDTIIGILSIASSKFKKLEDNGDYKDLSEVSLGLLNDVTFEYPEEFTKDAIKSSFDNYQKAPDRNNTRYVFIGNDYALVTSRDILKDEEITKHYGIKLWALWLYEELNQGHPHTLYENLINISDAEDNDNDKDKICFLYEALKELGIENLLDNVKSSND